MVNSFLITFYNICEEFFTEMHSNGSVCSDKSDNDLDNKLSDKLSDIFSSNNCVKYPEDEFTEVLTQYELNLRKEQLLSKIHEAMKNRAILQKTHFQHETSYNYRDV